VCSSDLAVLVQELDAALQCAQELWRAVRSEQAGRVRVEGHRDDRPAGGRCGGQQVLMAAVDPVEVADRDNRWLLARTAGDTRDVPPDSHGPRLSSA